MSLNQNLPLDWYNIPNCFGKEWMGKLQCFICPIPIEWKCQDCYKCRKTKI